MLQHIHLKMGLYVIFKMNIKTEGNKELKSFFARFPEK